MYVEFDCISCRLLNSPFALLDTDLTTRLFSLITSLFSYLLRYFFLCSVYAMFNDIKSVKYRETAGKQSKNKLEPSVEKSTCRVYAGLCMQLSDRYEYAVN